MCVFVGARTHTLMISKGFFTLLTNDNVVTIALILEHQCW